MNLVPAVNMANGPLVVTVDGVRQGGRRIVAYSDRLPRPAVSKVESRHEGWVRTRSVAWGRNGLKHLRLGKECANFLGGLGRERTALPSENITQLGRHQE